jgi:hypothetical protein
MKQVAAAIPVLLLILLHATAAAQPSTPGAHGGPFRIAGTVVSATTGSALSQARVTITDVKNPSNAKSVISSEEGHFEFDGLPAGKFSLQGARRAFVEGAYEQHDQFSSAIVTGAGVDTENLVLRLLPDAVLGGTVLDEFGEPMRNAQVTLYRESHAGGLSRIVRSRVAMADDRGSFEFAPLSAGDYFVSVTATPWYAMHSVSHAEGDAGSTSDADRPLDVAYATTYYGDVTEADDATPIPVRGGDRVSIEIHLHPVAALRIVFHAEDSERGINMPQLQKRVFGSVLPVQGQGIQQLSPGVFELFGIPPGRYSVQMPVGTGDGQRMQGADVDLSRDGQELDTTGAQKQSSVKITVRDRATLPQQLAIGLQDSERRTVGYQAVQPNGEATFESLDPGNYAVLVGSPSKAYSVRQIWAKASSTSGHTLSVPAGVSLDVQVSLASGEVELEGFVKKAGKPAPGAMVVLVPENPENNRELVRRDQSDLDGSFTLHSVIPGSYTITAIENGWDLDWSQPGVIAVYARRGRPVTIPETGGPGSRGTLHVSGIEAQPR